jgi:assimilatory nitrate reductase catalytic subunit
VILHQKVVDPPPGARADWKIICDLAARLGERSKFNYDSPRDIFDELRRASKGGASDYFGITWEKIRKMHGVFWPCPDIDHPGTPRLYEGGRFGHPDGKACEMHPRLAEKIRAEDGDFVTVESRRGSVTVRAMVVQTIRPDTVFIPYHFPLDRAANQCTIRALDPVSKIPEFKICAVRVRRTEGPTDSTSHLPTEAGGIR